MTRLKVLGPFVLAFLVTSAWVFSGCASYEVTRSVCSKGKVRVELAERRSDTLAIRLNNRGKDKMHIRWADAHIRWPNGYESPVTVSPSDPLSYIYPGGTIEYHVSPTHAYLPPDSMMYRRHSLTTSLFPKELYEAYENDYKLTLFVPICQGSGATCSTDEGGEASGWDVWTIETTFKQR